jgi:hypothetical protein
MARRSSQASGVRSVARQGALPVSPSSRRKIGYADLWDRYGPADGCRRVAPRDYACQ